MSPAAGRGTSSISAAGWAPASATLAKRLPIRGTGITLSPVQARMARQRIAAAGVADRVVCLEGDYGDLPDAVALADAVYAIESFAHAPAPARFFAEAARLLRPGGLLAVCDDFARPSPEPAAQRAIARFRRGWRINTLLDRTALRSLAAGDRLPALVDDRPDAAPGAGPPARPPRLPVRPSVRLAADRGPLRPPDRRGRPAAMLCATGVDWVRSRVVPANSEPAEGGRRCLSPRSVTGTR